MTDAQLLFILEKKFSGCQFQAIGFGENGKMGVTFFDKGGNVHKQVLNPDNTVKTLEV